MSLVRDILDAEYRLVRAPASLVQQKLINRLPAESIVRLSAAGGLGIVDAVAGRLTGNEVVSRRGQALIAEARASFQARWDDRRASHLRNRAEAQRERSYAHARRTEDMAHDKAVETVDKTLNDLVQAKADASVEAVETANARVIEAQERADRRTNVADANRKLEDRRDRTSTAGRAEADFWRGVADSNPR